MSWMASYTKVCSTSPRMGSLEMLLNESWSRDTTKEFPMTLTKRMLIVFLIHRRDWLSADEAHMVLWVLGCLW